MNGQKYTKKIKCGVYLEDARDMKRSIFSGLWREYDMEAINLINVQHKVVNTHPLKHIISSYIIQQSFNLQHYEENTAWKT